MPCYTNRKITGPTDEVQPEPSGETGRGTPNASHGETISPE